MRLRRVVQRLTGGGTARPPSPAASEGARRGALPAPGTRRPFRSIASPVVLDFSRNHFELFGLPARYAIDANALESAYRDLQRTVHPDRHAASDDDAARRLALQAAARVNEAYRTLADPGERARYLLALEGVEAFDAADTSLPVDFLERQLDRRERADRAGSCGDARALERVIDETREEAGAAERELGRLLGASDSRPQARVRVRELAFLAKVVRDLEGQLADVDV